MKYEPTPRELRVMELDKMKRSALIARWGHLHPYTWTDITMWSKDEIITDILNAEGLPRP